MQTLIDNKKANDVDKMRSVRALGFLVIEERERRVRKKGERREEGEKCLRVGKTLTTCAGGKCS